MTYTVESGDFTRAAAAVARVVNPRAASRQSWSSNTVIMGAIMLIGIACNIGLHFHAGTEDHIDLLFLGLLLLFASSAIYSPIRYKRALQRHYQELEIEGECFDLAWSSEAVSITSKTSFSRFEWAAVKSFLEIEGAYVLVLNSVSFLIFPTRHFTVDEQNAFKSAWEEHKRHRNA